MQNSKNLLAIIEVGGYPDFIPLYKSLGYTVEVVHQMRKAMSTLKKFSPEIIVTEFNFQSDFRDRTSSVESLLATVQRLHLQTQVVVFFEKEFAPQFQRLLTAYPEIVPMQFPIDEATLQQTLESLQAEQS